MVWGLISLVFLYLGYKLNSRKLEAEFGTDIHSLPESHDDAASNPLSYRQTQLLQFGLTFGIEGFFGAVVGVIYGPLTMIWCILGSVFLGSFLNYYSGMYSRAHHKSLLSVTEEIFNRRAYIILTLVLSVLLMIVLSVNYAFFVNIAAYAIKPSEIWYIFLAVVAVIGFIQSGTFNRICMGVGLFILLTTLYLCIMSITHFPSIEISANPLNYPNLKFAYPMLFFTVNVGVLSGLQALKSTLTAEQVRNERMGKGVFMASTLFQAGVVIVWILLLLAWNPSLKVLSAAIAKVAMPDIILHEYLTVHTGMVGEYAVFAMLAAVCLLSAGVMLRMAVKFIKEAQIAPNFSTMTYGVVLLAISVLFLQCPFVMHGHELINQLIALYLLYICMYLRKKNQQSYKELLYVTYILAGACIAYLPISLFHLPLIAGVFFGLTATFLIGIWHYYRYNKN